ncbi:hypothetical protein [Geodermatophilus sp. SYSU D00079]
MVRRRPPGEDTLLSAERRLTVEGLDDVVTTARRSIEDHLAACGAAPAGALRVVHHGMVTEDSDGPVEVAVPSTGPARPGAGLRIRLQPAGREAVALLTREEAELPRILGAHDAVARWCDAAGLDRAGSPAEVYLTGRDVDPGTPHLEIAWPVR